MARYSPSVLIGSFLVRILLYGPFFALCHINYLLAELVQGILGNFDPELFLNKLNTARSV